MKTSKGVKLLNKLIFRSIGYKNGVRISLWVRGLKNVICEGNNLIPEFCNFSGKVNLGLNTTLGVHNFMFGNITIGRYCQFGGYIALHATNHPISYPSTYINIRLFNGEMAKHKKDAPIRIGNDVWVGHGAIILSGVTVGNGAIIGSGAVVTKDVEPYSIVGGNPAKMIRKRFNDNIIKELQELKWWEKTPEEINKLKDFFNTDLSNITSIYEIINR